MIKLCHLLQSATILSATLLAQAEQFPSLQANGRKLIATQARVPTDAELPAIWEEIQRSPLDGIALTFSVPQAAVQKAGRQDPGTQFLKAIPWESSWFAEATQRVKALPRGRTFELFWKLNTNPGDVDWFDDKAWAIVVENGRIAAAAAREAGLTGLVFDAEPYEEAFRPFDYSRQPQRAGHSYSQYAAQARKRGADLMRAWAKEFPSMTLLTYFMHSYTAQWDRWLTPNAAALAPADRETALSQHPYGLYLAFMEGWMDALPPAMKLVDGCEHGYYPRSREEYLDFSHTMHRRALELITPGNHAKYLTQVSGGFGVFMDGGLILPDDSPFTIPAPAGMTKLDWFRLRLSWALEASDEYVWLYGEKGTWWTDVKRPLWEKSTPGVTAALTEARDLQGYELNKVSAKAADAPNLLRVTDFSEDKAWGRYFTKHSGGTVKLGDGRATFTGCGNGTIWQTFAAKPGQAYLISAKAKAIGSGGGELRLGWRDEKVALGHIPSLICLPTGPPDAEGYRLARGYATVPAGATQITFVLSARGQGGEANQVEWREPRLVLLSE
jgi:hypothetical protein